MTRWIFLSPEAAGFLTPRALRLLSGLRREFGVALLRARGSRPPAGLTALKPVAVKATGAGLSWDVRNAARGLDAELSACWLVCGAQEVHEAAHHACRPLKETGLHGVIAIVGRSGEDFQEVAGDSPEGGILPARALAAALARIERESERSRVVTDYATARDRLKKLRGRGRKVVFTNGVFDLFHVGHLRLLQAARAEGDILVVAVNGDDSARRLKGRSRPVVPQFARAEMAAAAGGADLCVIFGDKDPKKLLALLKPDVLAKGSEYSLREVVGARMVQAWGGRVALLPHVAGISTTRILEDGGRKR